MSNGEQQQDAGGYDAASDAGGQLEPTNSSSPLPFDGLQAPTPTDSAPPPSARWAAFAGVLVGGFLGALIGYGVGKILGSTQTWAAVGALVAGVGCAIGVGIIASLTLQAMNEWNVSSHPEDPRRANKQSSS